MLGPVATGLSRWWHRSIATRDFGKGVLFYARLLYFRKQAIPLVEDRFVSTEGRQPTEQELANALNAFVGRGVELAKKGAKEQDRPNAPFDEITLARTVGFALEGGKETLLLTRDRDVVEQFYKLGYLLDTHYRSGLIAAEYERQPRNFKPIRATVAGTFLSDCVEENGAEYLSLPVNATTRLLPDDHTPVPVHCLHLAPTDTPGRFKETLISFGFEREMIRAIECKGKTSRNVDWDDGRDLHICIHPAIQRELGGVALLAKNKTIEFDGFEFNPIDVELALRATEGLSRMKVLETSATEADEDPSFFEDLATYKSDVRLGFTSPDRWFEATADAAKRAVLLSPPWTAFYCDTSFLSLPIDDGLSDALSSRRVVAIRESWEAARKVEGSLRGRWSDAPKWLRVVDRCVGPHARTVFDHYLLLLRSKRWFGRHVRQDLCDKLGRDPTDQEFAAEVFRYRDGSKKILRARTGISEPHASLCADSLVVSCVINSVMDGADGVLLTGSRDIVEQFNTLMTVVSEDYRAWWYGKTEGADKYLHVFKPNPDLVRAGFCESPILERLDFKRATRHLPPSPIPVQVGCWGVEPTALGYQIAPVVFSAERMMWDMFEDKNEWSGQSAMLYSSRDIHRNTGFDKHGMWVQHMVGKNAWSEIGSELLLDNPSDFKLRKVPTYSLIRAQNFSDGAPLPWHSADEPFRRYDPTRDEFKSNE